MTDNTKDYLLGQMIKLKKQADDILSEAEKYGRDNTDEEMGEVKRLMTKLEEHKMEVKRIEDREAVRAQLEAIGAVSTVATQEPTREVHAKSLGEALVRSAEYRAIMEAARKDGFPRFDLPTIELKAVQDAILESDGTNADAIAPTWDPRLYAPGQFQFPLRIADLLTISQVANGNAVNYPVVTGRTGPTGNPTAEGADKKAATFTFDFETATLEKNTAFTGVSEEMFQDAPVITSYINNQLGLMVQQVEEASITKKLYAAATVEVDGTEIGGSNSFDAIRSALNAVQLAGGEPDGIIIHPNDAANLDIQQATGVGYYGGGPFAGPRTSVWGGLRYVITTSAVEGAPIVGAFRVGATLYRKGGLRLDTSNSHDDWFRKNLIAIRAELRSITAVHNPELFVEAVVGSGS